LRRESAAAERVLEKSADQLAVGGVDVRQPEPFGSPCAARIAEDRFDVPTDRRDRPRAGASSPRHHPQSVHRILPAEFGCLHAMVFLALSRILTEPLLNERA